MDTWLFIGAAVCFGLDSLRVPARVVSWTPLGLLLCVLTVLL